MITTLLLIAVAAIAVGKLDTEMKTKGAIFVILASIVLATFYDHYIYEVKIDALKEKIIDIQESK